MKLLIAIGMFMLVAFGGIFVYNNIIVLAPFREELKLCLVQARSLEDEEERRSEEFICFRTYPHFN